MAKDKTIYTCSECGGTSPKWLGQCPSCNAWNTLEETVAFMGSYQLGKELKKEEVDSIVTFLKALTGQLPKDVKVPKARPSGKATPKPDPM